MINYTDITNFLKKVTTSLRVNSDYLTELDQQIGDGDLGITAKKIADALDAYMDETMDGSDIGKFIMTAGMKINSAAPSTMGSLLAISFMKAGKVCKSKTEITSKDVVEMLNTAVESIQEKGKAKLGDKTLLDSLIPAVEALVNSLASGCSLKESGKEMCAAAQSGLEQAIPLRSKVGRASWVGDRTEGKIDPGCALVVSTLNDIYSG
jgi:phosphoenolpyruvate---glycerone phosphotransferase subunit DhaL